MDNWSKALCVAAGCGCIIGFAAFGPNLGDQPSDKIKNPAEKCLISITESFRTQWTQYRLETILFDLPKGYPLLEDTMIVKKGEVVDNMAMITKTMKIVRESDIFVVEKEEIHIFNYFGAIDKSKNGKPTDGRREYEHRDCKTRFWSFVNKVGNNSIITIYSFLHCGDEIGNDVSHFYDSIKQDTSLIK